MIRPIPHGAAAAGLLACTLLLALASPALAQGKSPALAKELASLMQERKLDSIAARGAAADTYVAALAFPGQLLVVSAKYASPALLNEKLIKQAYRDVYIDLNSASIPDSKVLITDMGADGLMPTRERDQPFDNYVAGNAAIAFDGNWREDKMSEQDYMKRYGEADETYVAALTQLLGELKK
jgi:hypothetical protein